MSDHDATTNPPAPDADGAGRDSHNHNTPLGGKETIMQTDTATRIKLNVHSVLDYARRAALQFGDDEDGRRVLKRVAVTLSRWAADGLPPDPTGTILPGCGHDIANIRHRGKNGEISYCGECEDEEDAAAGDDAKGNASPDDVERAILAEIVAARRHGQQKYGGGDGRTHDLSHTLDDWVRYARDHITRAERNTPLEGREHLVKAAGLLLSAIWCQDVCTQETVDVVATVTDANKPDPALAEALSRSTAPVGGEPPLLHETICVCVSGFPITLPAVRGEKLGLLAYRALVATGRYGDDLTLWEWRREDGHMLPPNGLARVAIGRDKMLYLLPKPGVEA